MVLDPPVLDPTPVPSPTPTSSTTENTKVNELHGIKSNSSSCSDTSLSSQDTASTFCTVYSKYGTRERNDSIDGEQSIDSNRAPMSSAYHQYKEACAASRLYNVTSVEVGETIGEAKPVNMSSKSSLDCLGDTEVLRTFRGTLSYDTRTMICVVCSTLHGVLSTGQGGAPPVMIFSDQNFLPTLCGKHSYISISRLEDGSLTVITGLAIEVLELQKVPIGSLILLGSASHLHNVGTTMFAIDWNNCAAELLSRVKNTKILPMVPILREDGLASLGNQLIEIRTWFGKIYEKKRH
jgi:hypothetical protein